MSEVASHLLNYSQKKSRAVSSRAYRSVLPASNGSAQFNMGSTINFDLGSNQANTFYDFQNSYLEFTILNHGVGGDITFDGNIGALSCIRKIEILTSGITLYSLDNWNVLLSAFFDTDVGRAYRDNQGAVLFGTKSATAGGMAIANNKKRTICFPLFLTPLFNANKYFPAFSRDGLQIRITLETALKSAIGTAGNALTGDTQIKVEDCKMVIYNVELNNEAMSAVNASTGGVYELVCDSYANSQVSIPENTSSIASVVGFSFSSLNRVILVHRPTATSNGTNLTHAITNRVYPRLQELSITINGEQYPQSLIKSSGSLEDDGNNLRGASEVFAELYIADNNFGNVSHSGGFGIQATPATTNYLLGFADADGALEATGTTYANTGRFLCAIDLESMRASDSDMMYSGVNTIGAVVSVNEKFNTVSQPCVLDVFGQYTMSVMLDMNTTGVFTVAV